MNADREAAIRKAMERNALMWQSGPWLRGAVRELLDELAAVRRRIHDLDEAETRESNARQKMEVELAAAREQLEHAEAIIRSDAALDSAIRVAEGYKAELSAAREQCPLCGHLWRQHDPEDGCCDSHSAESIGVCQCGRDMAWMHGKIAALSRAALDAGGWRP